MTSANHDLFSDIGTFPAPVITATAPGFPETAFDGGKLLRVVDSHAEYSVPCDFWPCVLCDQPIVFDEHQRGVAVKDGSYGWAHILCIVKVIGHRTNVQGYQDRVAHVDCVGCGQPWDEHLQYAYETLCCPTLHGDQAGPVQLYQHAPGHVGPLRPWWLVIAGEPPCGCNESNAVMKAA